MLCSLLFWIAVVAIWLTRVQGVDSHADLLQNFEFGLGKDVLRELIRVKKIKNIQPYLVDIVKDKICFLFYRTDSSKF